MNFPTGYYGPIRDIISHSSKHHSPFVANNILLAWSRTYVILLGVLPMMDIGRDKEDVVVRTW